MYLTTESGVRIDVESFVNCRYGYDIKCEVVCEEGSLNLPEPANTMVRSNDSRITPICHDWSERFIDATILNSRNGSMHAGKEELTVQAPGTVMWDR